MERVSPANNEDHMHRIYFTNFNYFSQREFKCLEKAKAYVRETGFEASILAPDGSGGDKIVASYSVFGGWR
jgi:hypothetical protein